MSSNPPSVLVIGAGMYVAGRGTSACGTVMPALVQAQSQGLIGEIRVAATNRHSIQELKKKLDRLNARMGTHTEVQGHPAGAETDPLAYQQALAELPRPACAIVVVPDHLHFQIAADVIRAGVHCLVVKPLTPTLAESRELVRLADSHNVYGAVEFHKRFDESNLLVRQALADGRLGDICYVTVEYSQRRMVREIFGSWLRDTNIFQYLGVHYVDLIYFFTGARPVRALATGQPYDPASKERHGSDAIQALVEWEEPASKRRFASTIVTNWIDPDTTSAMSDQKINIVGTKGRYQVDQKNRGTQLVTEAGGVEDVNPYFTQIYQGADGKYGVHGYGPRCINQFLVDVNDLTFGRCKRQDLIAVRPSFQDCLASTAVIEAVNTSLYDGGRWVEVEEVPLAGSRGLTGVRGNQAP